VTSDISAEEDEMLRPTRAGKQHRLAVPAAGAVVGSLASAGAAQIALVVTGVVTARALGPEDRGYLALVILIPAVLHGLGALGLPRAVTYYIANDPGDEATVLRAVRVPLVVQAVLLTVLQAGIMVVLLAGDPTNVKWAGVVSLPLLAANLIEMYGKAILQGQRRYAAFNVLRNAGLAFYLVGVVALALAGRTSVLAFTCAYVVASMLAGILTLGVAAHRTMSPQNATRVPQGALIRFGLRGYFTGLSPGVLRIDQALVGFVLAPAALGLYVVGLALTNLPTFISRSIAFIAFPQVAGTANAREDEMNRFLWFSLALTGAAVVALELAAGWLVPLFFGESFEGAVVLTRILLIGAFFEGARHVLTSTAAGSGRPGIGSIAELTSWVVLVIAVAALLPSYEAKGVAAATSIASAASFVVLVVLVWRTKAPRQRPGPARTNTA
jgi:O-antigen/teichoic acid export membrane protein